MANTYSQVLLMFVFSVKNRESLISECVADEVCQYMAGIVKARGQHPIAIRGMPDHIHLLCGAKPPFSIADFMRDIKANSSSYIREHELARGDFHWQRGYGVFSYGMSQLDDVRNYVLNQREHHQSKSFRSEFLDTLRLFRVEYDDRFLFDWIDHDPSDPPEFWLPPIGHTLTRRA